MEEKKLTDEELNELIEKLEYQSLAQKFFELSEAAYMLKYQKAEIERLKIRSDKALLRKDELEAKCVDLNYEIKELQKQVDELKTEKDLSIANLEEELTNYLFMSCSYGALVCGKMSLSIAQEQAKRFAPFMYRFIQQVVKDTAKEILVPLIGCEKQIDPLKTGIRWSVLKGFCKKFGVEVE